MHHTLQLDKFEGVDFKYENGFFEFQSENIQKNSFCPKCEYFLFLHEYSHIEKFRGTDFKNGNVFLSDSSKKIPKYEIFFENSKVFFLSETLSEVNFI